MDDVTFVFIADEESAEVLGYIDDAGLHPAAQPADFGLPLDPVTMAVLAGSTVLAARFVMSLWERFRGGARIDLGTYPPTVERLRDIPYGVILILTVTGDVRIETVDEPKEVVERILSGILTLPADATSQLVIQLIGALSTS